jgi:hypothetical protein
VCKALAARQHESKKLCLISTCQSKHAIEGQVEGEECKRHKGKRSKDTYASIETVSGAPCFRRAIVACSSIDQPSMSTTTSHSSFAIAVSTARDPSGAIAAFALSGTCRMAPALGSSRAPRSCGSAGSAASWYTNEVSPLDPGAELVAATSAVTRWPTGLSPGCHADSVLSGSRQAVSQAGG